MMWIVQFQAGLVLCLNKSVLVLEIMHCRDAYNNWIGKILTSSDALRGYGHVQLLTTSRSLELVEEELGEEEQTLETEHKCRVISIHFPRHGQSRILARSTLSFNVTKRPRLVRI